MSRIQPPPPTLIDRVVSYFSPTRGVERLRARTAMSVATGGQGGYEGGRRNRRGTQRWRPPEQSADADVLPDLPDLRGRARDLRRNVPIAAGALATVCSNVVGDGLKMKPSIQNEILGLSDEQATEWEAAAKREWMHFCRTADFTGVQHFNDLQALIFTAMLDSGDVFVIRRYRKDAGDLYGTKLQVIEADRVSNPDKAADTDEIAGGVAIDKDGRAIAYHVTNRHPGGKSVADLKWNRVATRTKDGKRVVLHLYDRLRPEQTRGVPYLAPVIEHLKQLGDYADAEVKAAVVSAMFTVFVTSDADQTDNPIVGEFAANDGLQPNEVKLGSGAVIGLAPGESVTQADPKRPNDKFDPFVLAFLRQVGAALELPFELLVKHFTSSYSASRAALEMAWQMFRRRRGWLARHLCQVVYGWMLEEAIAEGRLVAPGFFDDPVIAQAYSFAEWLGQSKPIIDPEKEARADRIDILELRTKTREQVCMERTGGELDHKIVQLGIEERAIAAEGLQVSTAPAPAQPTGDAEDGGDLQNGTNG